MAVSACVYLDYSEQQEITSHGISDGISSIVVGWVILDAMREKSMWITCRFFLTTTIGFSLQSSPTIAEATN